MAFSGALTLTDLNDFITPAQACIKPVEQTNPSTKVNEPGAAATEIQIDASGSYYEVSNGRASGQKLQTAEISLNDCLACSGCITSAESVLITLQSHTEVLSFLSSNPPPSSSSHRIPVLSISPQSLASLAACLSPPPPLAEVLSRVHQFARTLGFEHVFDTTFARELALREHISEFEERKRRGEGALPMLASACPGWICYAEKTHGEMLPFIARTKSPQQVMGTLVKEWLSDKWQKRPDQIYHVTVMPCYDKKLEASRSDFYNDMYATRDVDCVITTGELDRLMREKGWDLAAPPPPSPSSSLTPNPFPTLLTHPGTSSGSYLHSLLSHISESSPVPLTLTTHLPRAAQVDLEEYTLSTPDGTPVFRGAKCYGFRNLQNIVRKVGRAAGVQVGRGAAGRLAGGARRPVRAGKADAAYDYVEVMACPGGCVNGGGQLKPAQAWLDARDPEGFARDWPASGVAVAGLGDASARWGDKAWTREVEKAYWDGREPAFGLPTPPASPKMGGGGAEDPLDALAGRVLADLCRPRNGTKSVRWYEQMDEEAEERRRQCFRTEYREVESEVVGLGVKW
ncbi:iron hydrogenase [Auriscalpium vulgare]|uniref:Iron hydrogenase n=1 Tax=Auriscalpium vulgare TaxID=40419 RepID=A0ACB8S0M5_9AGAM|nr:iron hydrogenase [Auriscalpium vulgare]